MRKDARSSSRTPKRKKKIRSSEITGILLILLAVFLLISLVSYNSADPSWATASTKHKIHNYAGKAGASISEALLQLLGFTSFIIPLALLYLGIKNIFAEAHPRFILKSGAICILGLISSTLLYIFFQKITWHGAEIQAGGFLGHLLSSFLIQYFNHTGSILILIGLLILFFIFTLPLSLGRVFMLISKLFGFIFKEVRIKITHYQKEQRRKRMRVRVIEKYTTSPQKPEEKKKEKKKKKKKVTKKKPARAKPSKQPDREKLLFPEMEKRGDYSFPPFNLLDVGKAAEKIDKNELYEKKINIEEKLRQFQIEGEVKEYHPGPIITTYEYYPHPGVKVSQVASRAEDLSLALRAESVRIQRIAGKSSLGVEVPNNNREIIKIREIIQSEKFLKSPSKLTFALGKTIHGDIYITDLAIMPHLLIAGATGTGKSVALNALIASILYKAAPDEVKLILIDPKRLEFAIYEGIPHLLSPVVRDPKKAEGILMAAIKKMDARYHKLGLLGVRNIDQFNQQVKKIQKERKGKLSEEEKEQLKPLPYIVIIIDELAELMMIGAQEIEYCIARLAQLARAVGIHLVLATQRPSIDVITGTIKNNFASRIALRVPSKIDSRIIIDSAGAEQLLGHGDLLFMPPNYPRLLRLHCSYISLAEVNRLVKFVKKQGKPVYDDKIYKVIKSPAGFLDEEESEKDPLFEKAVELILLTGQASASYLQRKLRLGYARAARIIDQMEQEAIVGPSEGSKPREILVNPETYLRRLDGEE